MKKMKKIVALLLAMVLAFGMSVSVMAAESSKTLVPGGSEELPVSVQVTTGTSGGTMYHVTLKWNDLDFQYKRAGEGTWNVQTHEYDSSNAAGWLASNSQIAGTPINDETSIYAEVSSQFSIENHSNAQVSVTASLVNDEEDLDVTYEGVALTIYKVVGEDNILENAELYTGTDSDGDNYVDGDKNVYKLTVNGEPNAAFDWGTNPVNVGTIYITISSVTTQ